MTLRFGTDGIRGDARNELSPFVVEALARAGAEVLGSEGFAVGRDTRESGPSLTAAIHSGVSAAGGYSFDLGVVPTPTVALWCHANDVPGAVVSASHNPWHDNGVKFFAAGGLKLSNDVQADIQDRFDRLIADGPSKDVGSTAATAATVVPATSPDNRHDEATARHVAHLVDSLDGRTLEGLKLVVDTANGAAVTVAREVLETLGAEVEIIHGHPDGRNINDACGSNHPESLQQAVVERGADAGIALDGDADRLIAVGHTGDLVDGDQIIAMCALDRHRRGALRGDSVVVTVMTNLGFRRSMNAAGIDIIETAVGDRHVLEALARRGLSLGGEQSGHVIFPDLATTGDGLLTAIQLLDVVKRAGRPLSELAMESMERLPQVLVNIRTATWPDDLETVIERLAAPMVAQLGDRGRVLVRPSGTEPLIRVMIEAETDAEASRLADELAAQLSAALG